MSEENTCSCGSGLKSICECCNDEFCEYDVDAYFCDECRKNPCDDDYWFNDYDHNDEV